MGQSRKNIEYDPSMGEILFYQMRGRHIQTIKDTVKPIGASNSKQGIEYISHKNAYEPSLESEIKIHYLLAIDKSKFVDAAYVLILDRHADPTGLNYYNKLLQKGRSRIQILGQIAASGETPTAKRYYLKLRWPYLLLKSRHVPVIGWIAEFVSAIMHYHLQELLMNDDEQFVISAYQHVLGRMPDPDGFAYYLSKIRSGNHKISILSDLLASKEGKLAGNKVAGLAIISMLYRFRQLPIIKWIIDLILLPSIVVENKKRLYSMDLMAQRTSIAYQADMELMNKNFVAISNEMNKVTNGLTESVAQLNAALPQVAEDIKMTITARLALDMQRTQQQLQGHYNQQMLGVQALLSKEFLSVSNEMNKVTDGLAGKIEESVAQIQRTQQQFQEHYNQQILGVQALLNKEFLSVSNEMNKVTDGLAVKIAESVTQLNPQLGRIEQYGLAAARRISIPCGDSSVMIRTSVGYILCADEDYALIATLIESGELESGTRFLIQRILNPGDVFIDVGANIGMHTLAAAHVMQGKGRVVAYEPYPQTAKLLQKSIWMNGYSSMVDIYCSAVSNEKREQTLYLGSTSGHHSLFPLEESNVSVTVQVTTLDQLITDIPIVNLIKIDAEGAELEVLAGAELLLKSNKDVGIIAEFGSSHLKRIGITTQEWLEHFFKLGFEYQAIHPDSGALNDITIQELDRIESVNLFFARSQSPIWGKAGMVK